MEFVANLTIGKAIHATLHGRQYLVAPITSIVPGVLNGSKGSLYYPDEEVSRNVSAWDGMPLTAYHPMSPDGGHASANDRGILDRQGIGFIRDSAFNGKLQHKAWFDVEKTREVDNTLLKDKPEHRILPRLSRGDPIELSTGLYTTNIPASEGANHNGKIYNFIAKDYVPDHIAVLPDQIGACSISDGCGVLVNTAATPSPTQNVDPQCPT